MTQNHLFYDPESLQNNMFLDYNNFGFISSWFYVIMLISLGYRKEKRPLMKIKVNEYSTATYTTSNNGTIISDIPEGESFEEVLVLNQKSLKAMAIDAMVAESATGSVDPDAVNAAAIMKFRSTLASHIVAPVPTEDKPLGTPHNAETNTTPSVDKTPSNTQAHAPATTTDIYNEGALKCSDELNSYFKEAANTYNIDVKLLKSIAYCESNFNPNCTSSAGAMGIMQMMPETAKYFGISDPYNARESIMGGAKYFSQMLARYNGNTELALAAYNAGPGNVDKYGGIPPFKETQNYVPKVLKYYNS
jgi:hypothetical protein